MRTFSSQSSQIIKLSLETTLSVLKHTWGEATPLLWQVHILRQGNIDL